MINLFKKNKPYKLNIKCTVDVIPTPDCQTWKFVTTPDLITNEYKNGENTVYTFDIIDNYGNGEKLNLVNIYNLQQRVELQNKLTSIKTMLKDDLIFYKMSVTNYEEQLSTSNNSGYKRLCINKIHEYRCKISVIKKLLNMIDKE